MSTETCLPCNDGETHGIKIFQCTKCGTYSPPVPYKTLLFIKGCFARNHIFKCSLCEHAKVHLLGFTLGRTCWSWSQLSTAEFYAYSKNKCMHCNGPLDGSSEVAWLNGIQEDCGIFIEKTWLRLVVDMDRKLEEFKRWNKIVKGKYTGVKECVEV